MNQYNIKDVINKMKITANVDTNMALAKLLDISYNTLNTWIKRKKLPQEYIINFCIKYNCSLDYLLLNKDDNRSPASPNMPIQVNNNDKEQNNSLIFKGRFKELNIEPGTKISLDSINLVSNAFYLLNKDNILFISQVTLNPFNKTAYIKEFNTKLDLDEFNQIKLGLLIL